MVPKLADPKLYHLEPKGVRIPFSRLYCRGMGWPDELPLDESPLSVCPQFWKTVRQSFRLSRTSATSGHRQLNLFLCYSRSTSPDSSYSLRSLAWQIRSSLPTLGSRPAFPSPPSTVTLRLDPGLNPTPRLLRPRATRRLTLYVAVRSGELGGSGSCFAVQGKIGLT